MASRRKNIRHAICNVLKLRSPSGSYQTAAKGNIYPTRLTPLWSPELPAVCVYTLSEQANIYVKPNKSYYRDLTVVTEIIVTADEGCDDLLDELQEQVETLLHPIGFVVDPKTNAETADDILRMTGTEVGLSGQGSQTVLGSRISWNVPYIYDTATASPQNASGEFLTAHTEADIDQDDQSDIVSTQSVRS